VSGDGAYESEMNDVALFEDALRAAVPVQPDPGLRATLVPRLAEVARASTLEAETRAARWRSRSRRALVARVGIAVALIPLVLAGLAFAGVKLPAPARSALDSLGITLPNQALGEQGTAADEGPGGDDGITTTGKSDGDRGNSSAAQQHALAQRQTARGKAIGHSRGRAVGLTGSTPPGQSGETGPPDFSNAGGSPSTRSAKTTHPSPPVTPAAGRRHQH
jgi:hypothetical protein